MIKVLNYLRNDLLLFNLRESKPDFQKHNLHLRYTVKKIKQYKVGVNI